MVAGQLLANGLAANGWAGWAGWVDLTVIFIFIKDMSTHLGRENAFPKASAYGATLPMRVQLGQQLPLPCRFLVVELRQFGQTKNVESLKRLESYRKSICRCKSNMENVREKDAIQEGSNMMFMFRVPG